MSTGIRLDQAYVMVPGTWSQVLVHFRCNMFQTCPQKAIPEVIIKLPRWQLIAWYNIYWHWHRIRLPNRQHHFNSDEFSTPVSIALSKRAANWTRITGIIDVGQLWLNNLNRIVRLGCVSMETLGMKLHYNEFQPSINITADSTLQSG